MKIATGVGMPPLMRYNVGIGISGTTNTGVVVTLQRTWKKVSIIMTIRKEVNIMTNRRKIEWTLLIVVVAIWIVLLPIII